MRKIIISIIVLFPVIACATFALVIWRQSQVAPTIEINEIPDAPSVAVPEDKPIILGFVGDLMFDRYIREKQGPEYRNTISSELIKLFNETDGMIGNLEGPITNFDSVSDYNQNNPDHYRFTFDPAVTDLLNRANFIATSIGNNHSTNFGIDGVEQTIKYLTDAGISSFGNPNNSEHTSLISIGNLKLGLVAYNYGDLIPIEQTIENIKQLDSLADHVIVIPHWGTEYESLANTSQRNLAEKFVDAGADLIIGSHPHVIQNSEMIDGVLVYYSLGNFIFDQYFQPEVRCGLVLRFKISKHQIDLADYKYSYLEPTGITRLSKDSECINFD